VLKKGVKLHPLEQFHLVKESALMDLEKKKKVEKEKIEASGRSYIKQVNKSW
jgi:hypothetical protein